MKQKLAILAAVVAIAALGCWTALAFYNPNVLRVNVAMTGDVAVNGKKPVVFSGSLDPAAPNPKVRVSWIIGKFQLQDASGAAVVWDDFMPGSTDTVYRDYTVGTTFSFTNYAFGVAASGIDDQAITIEALHNTPMHHTVNFTVVNVDKIEYQRFDLPSSPWVADLNIAAGAKNTDVHKARVRITIVPAKAGVSVTAAKNGGNGDPIPGVLSPTTAQSTDSGGQVFCDYTSSDKIEDLTIKVTELAGCVVSVDLGATLHQKWDISGAYDWDAPLEFYPGEADDVRFYPTLDVSGGAGAIDGHLMEHYTPWIELLVVQYDLSSGTVAPDTVIGEYPDYWYVTPPPCMPTGFVVEDFVEITSPVEESPGGIYRSTHTVYDWWDFNFSTGILTDLFVMKYELGACDNDVRSSTPFSP